MKVLIIDNIDSFVYNLYQYVGEMGAEVVVKRNRADLKEIEREDPDRMIVSPGPGRPEKAGVSVEAIKELSPSLPVLGVCLGHQAIAYAFGGKIRQAKEIMHGKVSFIEHHSGGVLRGVENPLSATRYHSLVVGEVPEELEINAWTADGEIMGLKHRDFEAYGLQFHPESILTPRGKRIVRNFLEI